MVSSPKTDNDARQHVTFEQAEGVEPLPTQLRLRELSAELRALLWEVVYDDFQNASRHPIDGGPRYLVDPWRAILYDMHVKRDARMADDFGTEQLPHVAKTRATFEKGDYVAVLGWLQWALRHPKKPFRFAERIERALRTARAAYRVLDNDTIVPNGSHEENRVIEQAFAALAKAEFRGARSHLRKAAQELSAGRNADSVRESVHAVEAVARTLDPNAQTLGPALARLEATTKLNGAMKRGFEALYGFTNTEQGIRHALLEKDAPAVDEADALFMFGASAAFVSYLIGKARAAELLK